MLRQLETLAERFIAERAVVARNEQLAEVRYSTPELLALEERMLNGATARSDAGCAVVAPEHLRATLEAFPTIAQDQADALTDLTRSGAGVSLLIGKAGYGKTFVAGAVAHAYGLQGHRLIGMAPTGLAANGLGNEGYARLPAYAPDLNPVEYLWANLKDVELANTPGASLVEVADAAQCGIERVCASDDLVAGFLAHTGLAFDDEPST